MFKIKILSIYLYYIMLRGVNFQTLVKIDINSITDSQNLPEYINNKELGNFVFEIYVFIN